MGPVAATDIACGWILSDVSPDPSELQNPLLQSSRSGASRAEWGSWWPWWPAYNTWCRDRLPSASLPWCTLPKPFSSLRKSLGLCPQSLWVRIGGLQQQGEVHGEDRRSCGDDKGLGQGDKERKRNSRQRVWYERNFAQIIFFSWQKWGGDCPKTLESNIHVFWRQ